MDNSKWISGMPTEPGYYWLIPNAQNERFIAMSRMRQQYLMLRIDFGEPYVYGTGGSMPISMVYNKKYSKSFYLPVESPKKWVQYKSQAEYGRNTRTWVKDSKGRVGFGILTQGSHGLLGGVIWEDGNVAFGDDILTCDFKQYHFSPIEIPVF